MGVDLVGVDFVRVDLVGGHHLLLKRLRRIEKKIECDAWKQKVNT